MKQESFVNQLVPLPREFYQRDTLIVARELLGKYLVKVLDDSYVIGRITETEAYIGAIDKACHAYGGKITPRTKTLYQQGGTSYVYLIYGMYNCMNVVTEPQGQAAAVLLRGVQITNGYEKAALLRYKKTSGQLNSQQHKNISNGPGKLCKAMDITKAFNGMDLCGDKFFITAAVPSIKAPEFEIGSAPRIGIDYAQEAKDFPWRFFVY